MGALTGGGRCRPVSVGNEASVIGTRGPSRRCGGCCSASNDIVSPTTGRGELSGLLAVVQFEKGASCVP